MFESEEDRIVDKITNYIKNARYPYGRHIMLRNERILDFDDYSDMVKAGKVKPQNAYVYFGINLPSEKALFYYPFLAWYDDFLEAYLSKLGFYYGTSIVPATGLKYVALVERYGDYLLIELVNLDVAANNLNLPNIVVQVLGEKLVSGEKVLTRDEYHEILGMSESQQLFAGYSFSRARDIIDYYYAGVKPAKEAVRIAMDYDRIFNPYRVCYDMDNCTEIDCWKIKLV